METSLLFINYKKGYKDEFFVLCLSSVLEHECVLETCPDTTLEGQQFDLVGGH